MQLYNVGGEGSDGRMLACGGRSRVIIVLPFSV